MILLKQQLDHVDTRGLESRISRALHNIHQTQRTIMPIESLIATQEYIDPCHITKCKDNKKQQDLPFVVKDKEHYYIHDGHHRICLAKLEGNKMVEVDLLVL